MKPDSPGALASPIGRLLLCAVFLLGIAAQVGWAQAPPEIETIMTKMLAATESRSLDAFIAFGDDSFRSGMTQGMLNSFSSQFTPRLKQGYTATYLTRLNQEGYDVYLWKLEFKDGGDDRLVTLAVKDGKVKAFYMR